MAALLKKELGSDVNRVKGRIQEFSVRVGDEVVARKRWFRWPTDEAIVTAVRQALVASSG